MRQQVMLPTLPTNSSVLDTFPGRRRRRTVGLHLLHIQLPQQAFLGETRKQTMFTLKENEGTLSQVSARRATNGSTTGKPWRLTEVTQHVCCRGCLAIGSRLSTTLQQRGSEDPGCCAGQERTPPVHPRQTSPGFQRFGDGAVLGPGEQTDERLRFHREASARSLSHLVDMSTLFLQHRGEHFSRSPQASLLVSIVQSLAQRTPILVGQQRAPLVTIDPCGVHECLSAPFFPWLSEWDHQGFVSFGPPSASLCRMLGQPSPSPHGVAPAAWMGPRPCG